MSDRGWVVEAAVDGCEPPAPSLGSSIVGFNYIEQGADKDVIKHHGHHHPLVKFKKSIQNVEDYEGYCNGCGFPMDINSGGFMICIEDDCDFCLHEFCALLSNRDTLHYPQHTSPLKLTQSIGLFKCNVCFMEFLGKELPEDFLLMRYHCKDCNFGVDLRCASMAFLTNVPYHQHPLTPKLSYSNPLVSCSVCGENQKEKLGFVSFECKICPSFSIHQECSTLPCTLEHDSHDHILHIKKCFEIDPPENPSCGICKGGINLELTFYYCCEVCHYYIHINCSSKKWDKEIEKPPVGFGELMEFPLPSFESVDKTLSYFIKQICHDHDHEQGKTSSKELFDRVQHDHPLILNNNHLSDLHDHEPGETSRSSSEVLDSNPHDHEQEESSSSNLDDIDLYQYYHPTVLNNDHVSPAATCCKACTLSVSGDAPFYSCTESSCDFILHKWCTKLPLKMLYPEYPITGHKGHMFHLHTNLDNFLCRACGSTGKGFAYKCTVHKNYYIHVKCFSLPSYIKHETHKHPLILLNYTNTYLGGCYACRDDYEDKVDLYLYGCRACNFSLHLSCLLLPREIPYKYDKHGFKLTYCIPKLKYEPPAFTDHGNASDDDPDEPAGEYCELCEEEMDSDKWFYHCNECKRYAHRTCAKWNLKLF
ncbi:uncharacterized protein LOC124936640 [Impatiens glandulifera]|uniref:uncharacterized protein LOC124936640 n=1 Tax=Impatiens glandulifera TaxID=253017 RepID=UPI001FB0A222|nr:uncharacterized protein LOC124936640 [Impatiens glandulifera]